MLASFATSFFFALSVILAARSARWLGGTMANLGRMVIALVLLSIWAHVWGSGLHGESFPFFLMSGMVGFGLGDLALFQAITRVGPRLSILLTQCLAVPIAMATERLWLGTQLREAELLWSGLILVGVGVALAPGVAIPKSTPAPDGELPPDPLPSPRSKAPWLGICFGVGAATGQALGAVISRKAYAVAHATGITVDGGTAAYQRMIGGIAVAASFYIAGLLWMKVRKKTDPAHKTSTGEKWRKGSIWVVLNAFAGPILGIACYQHALATTPSGLVLPIVATSPIIAIGLAFVVDGERPSILSVAGGFLAVAGAIALVMQ